MGNSDSRVALVEAFSTLKVSDKLPDARFWSELWGARTTAEEIYELLGPSAVRELRTRRPRNLVCLLVEATMRLAAVEANPQPDQAQQALNAVRVLQRLLPSLLEDPGDDLVFQLCWSTEPLDTAVAPPSEWQAGDREPLAHVLLRAVMKVLFLPGFTVHSGALKTPGVSWRLADGDGNDAAQAVPVQPGAIWCAGVGASLDVVASNRNSAFVGNRIEVLRLLLTALCDPLYKPGSQVDACGSPWLTLASGLDTPNAATLFFSLLNVVLSYEPAGGVLPYGGHMGSSANLGLVEKSAQVLMVLLDQPPAPSELGIEQDDPTDGSDEAPNVYRKILASLSDPKDLTFMFNGFVRLLSNLVDAANTMLPSSVPRISFYQEVLVLLWKVLEDSEAFSQHALRRCDSTQLVAPLCYLMHSVRHERHLVGIIHICTFVLLKLSGDRQLAIGCSRVPYKRRLPTDLPLFTGSHCDLLLITLHQVMMAGGDRIASQYNCFLTIICNISPYCKSLSLEASMKLVSLFEVFVSRPFLYSAEANSTYVGLLLETFCNIAQYQFEGNPRVVYALVRQRALFESLFALTVEGARAEAERVASLKASKAAAAKPRRGLPAVEGVPFEPSEEWLSTLIPAQSQMTLQCLIKHVSAEIDEFCQAAGGDADEGSILGCIESLTMVGLLPVPHAIVVRQYQKNAMTSLWFTAQLWVIIFMQNQVMPLFDGGKIRLFSVGVAEAQARAAREAVRPEDGGGKGGSKGASPTAAAKGAARHPQGEASSFMTTAG